MRCRLHHARLQVSDEVLLLISIDSGRIPTIRPTIFSGDITDHDNDNHYLEHTS